MASRLCRHVWGITLVIIASAATASAQPRDELARLSREVVQLLNEAKYAEAIPIAQRALAIAQARYGKDHPEVGVALNNLAEAYRSVGRFADAEPLYKRDIAITEKARGPDHPDVAGALNNLALLYAAQGRQNEGEAVARRSLAIREKALGPEHLQVANSLDTLAGLYDSLGRYTEGEALYKRSLAIREKLLGPDQPDVGTLLNNLAALYESQGRYDEAEPLYRRSIAILEKAVGPDHPDVGATLNNLALLYKLEGRYAEAEPLYKRDLAINTKANGPDHPDVAGSLSNLGLLYLSQGRYAEAETLFKTSLAKREQVLGLEHPAVGASLNNLAGLYYAQDRYDEAEPLLVRALAIREKAFGPDHPEVGNALNNLAGLYATLGRSSEAESLLKRALAITEKIHGPNHPIVGTPLNNLTLLYAKQGRYAEAESLATRALDVREKGLGPQHADVAVSLNTLAIVNWGQGRYAEAEALYKRSISTFQTALGPDHPDVSSALNSLAGLFFERNDWPTAARYWRQSTDLILRRSNRGADIVGKTMTSAISEPTRNSSQFESLVKVTHRLVTADEKEAQQLAQEMFQTAQWGQSSETAASIAQMSARQANGTTELARLVRERQDLVTEWQQRDKLLIAVVSKPQTDRNTAAEQGQRARLAAIDSRLAEIDKTLQRRFPEYAVLTAAEPLSVADAQGLLRPDEALVFFLDAPGHPPTSDEAFLWVVTRTDARWTRLEVSGKALADRILELRCGLDATLWDDADSAKKCQGVVGASPRTETVTIGGKDEIVDVLPFDPARAHELYKALLGPVADTIQNKRLIVVPSGPLTSLPFNVLVTEPPKTAIPDTLAQYRDVAWLGARTAITVLPSVSSLKALREFAKVRRASRPYLGIGNPLLDGAQDDPVWGANYKQRAELARAKRCPQMSSPQHVASARGPRPVRGFTSMFRGTHADIEEIRYQAPLPETADELCEVALRFGVPDSEILLGADATETRVKDLSEQGRLAEYAIVHFATHGALAGQVRGSAEPGLILTPPPKGTSDPGALERDDGFLTTSEIATLKLDADWVILSACNTAGAKGEGAEALSGMARAFFYAGARALLVSHWEVDSDAAVNLTTRAFAELKAHPEIGRAEAIRISMRELIEKGTSAEAHPSMWAPFVVVGEGAAQ